jgi:hypothetical protein
MWATFRPGPKIDLMPPQLLFANFYLQNCMTAASRPNGIGISESQNEKVDQL